MKTKLLLLTFLTSVFSFAQEGTNLIEFSTDTSFDNQYPKNTTDIEDWRQFYNENKTNNPKPTILVDPILDEGFTQNDFSYDGIIYDNENNAYYISNTRDGFYSIKEYNVENNSWIEIINDTIVYDIGYPFINAIYKNSNGDYFIQVEYIHLSNSGPYYNAIFEIFTINDEKKLNSIYNDNLAHPYEDFAYSNDHFYIISNGGVEYENIEGETVEIITVYIKKSNNTTTLFPTTGKDNIDKIEFNTDTSFDYEYSLNGELEYVQTEVWDQFYDDHKTTNIKPTILVDPVIEEGYYDQGIIYDNENNAYSASYTETNDGYLCSIKEYNVENNSWSEVFNGAIPYPLFLVKGSGIYKNSTGDYFIKAVAPTLILDIHFDILKLASSKVEYIYSYYNNNYHLDVDLFLLNDHFYIRTSDLVTLENSEGESVSGNYTKIEKSNNTTTLSIDNINLYNKEKINLNFENGKFTSQQYNITNILTTTGQSIPNKNLESNVIYIVVLSNANRVKFSVKILTQ